MYSKLYTFCHKEESNFFFVPAIRTTRNQPWHINVRKKRFFFGCVFSQGFIFLCFSFFICFLCFSFFYLFFMFFLFLCFFVYNAGHSCVFYESFAVCDLVMLSIRRFLRLHNFAILRLLLAARGRGKHALVFRHASCDRVVVRRHFGARSSGTSSVNVNYLSAVDTRRC